MFLNILAACLGWLTMRQSDIEFINFLILDCGYRDIRLLPNDKYAAIMPLMFTHAIIIGSMGDRFSYDDRWCYHSYESASKALNEWDGVGEPMGWHRRPASGRRVSAEGEEYIHE